MSRANFEQIKENVKEKLLRVRFPGSELASAMPSLPSQPQLKLNQAAAGLAWRLKEQELAVWFHLAPGPSWLRPAQAQD